MSHYYAAKHEKQANGSIGGEALVFLGSLAVQPDPDKCNTVEVQELFIGSLNTPA
jgi:hypothetical protein